MHAMVNIALRAARDAAEVLAQSVDRLDRITIVEDSADSFVTSVHRDADRSILFHLQKSFPQHSYLSRISGHKQGAEGQPLWLIDPLLGGRNFSRGYTTFAVSVACQVEGKLAHAVLIDPIKDEEYSASRGDGAYLNSRRLRVSKRDELKGAVVALPGRISESTLENYQSILREVKTAGADWRSSGCGGLDLVHTAAARLDGGWLVNPGKTSIAAATLILQEAGGLVSDTQGRPDFFASDFLIFGNPKCFRQLIKICKTS